MAGIHQGVQHTGTPARSPGRNFVSADPERQREAGAESLRPKAGREAMQSRGAAPYSRTSLESPRVWWGIGSDEGGSARGRR